MGGKGGLCNAPPPLPPKNQFQTMQGKDKKVNLVSGISYNMGGNKLRSMQPVPTFQHVLDCAVGTIYLLMDGCKGSSNLYRCTHKMHKKLFGTNWTLCVVFYSRKVVEKINEVVHWCFIHVCFVLVKMCDDYTPWWCACFSNDLIPSWITQQIAVEKSAHRGASARRESQTMFKIVTWAKQTWIIRQCTMVQ